MEVQIKPKIDSTDSKYTLVELRKDLGKLRDQYLEEYPTDLV